MDRRRVFESFAALLRYPEADYLERALACLALVPEELVHPLQQFVDTIEPLSLHEREELFLQTFDLNPVCSLEVGWHIFGENYDRGLLMVRVKQLMQAHGVEPTLELPDHLVHVLPLLGRMERAAAADFAAAVVLPAMAKMLEALTGKQNPYEPVLEAVRRCIHAEFTEIPPAVSQAPVLRILPEGVSR